MFIIYVLAFKFTIAEGRVFCEDINATPWIALGNPCPVTCSTIITAVDSLKVNDYHYLLEEKIGNRSNMSAGDLYTIGQKIHENAAYGRIANSLQPNLRKHLKLYNTYHKLLSNENFEDGLKKELSKMAADFNRTCSNMATKLFYNKKFLINNKWCARKLNKRPEILIGFTKFLNKYADPKYPFNEEMSGLILQKLEGSLSLRYGEMDFNKIVSYLKKALRYHGSNTKTDQVIKLHSKNCMTINIPGCFCKTGYVESRGQCVKPQDCLTNPMLIEFLDRIILH